MKKEDIIALPNPHLRQKSTKIKPDDVAKKLIEDMISATLDWEDSRPHEIGAALAAVQIDSPKRAVIVRGDFDNKQSQVFTVLLNPQVIKLEGAVTSDHEGCLSVKDIYGLVPRHTKVKIKALDINGNEIRIKAEGFLARVLQHEIDHTNGILFIDHIKDKENAFFQLDEQGELKRLDYEKYIKANRILWD